MEYLVQGKKLVWDFDESNHDARKLKPNNLYIEGFWNMKDTVVSPMAETCVGMRVVDENNFYFVTFGGFGYTMEIDGDNIRCIDRKFVK